MPYMEETLDLEAVSYVEVHGFDVQDKIEIKYKFKFFSSLWVARTAGLYIGWSKVSVNMEYIGMPPTEA